MASLKPFIDVQGLTKSFGAQVLFKNISFSIAEGQKVGIIAKTERENLHFSQSLLVRKITIPAQSSSQMA